MKQHVNCLKLFKAVPITKKGTRISTDLLKETISKGFVFSAEVMFNYTDSELKSIIELVTNIYGLEAKKLNNTFHKSWSKIKNADVFDLVCEQIVHYITTYGFESLGIYNSDTVYIPTEKLKIPKIDIEKIPLIAINGYTELELKNKLLVMLDSGIALSEETKNDVINVALFLSINEEDLEKIKNKEVKVMLLDFLGIIPKNPTEFLRLCVYKSIEKTLLIKNKETIQSIKTKVNLPITKLFQDYSDLYGLEKLAEIFFRYKPIFLAFKSNIELNRIINKIRRLADTYHKPMPEDFLNNVTNYIKKKSLDKTKLIEELKKSNIFRKIRLGYALKFRITDPDAIMYKIRNGKTFVENFEKQTIEIFQEPLEIILNSISNDLKEKVSGKKIYIPNHITYTLPATEKQFVGNFPNGTCISTKENMIFGIHWYNVKQERIDLDLSLIDMNGSKIGWDSSYFNEDRTVLFSGDMTDAQKPLGASELFYIDKKINMNGIMFVNYFNHIDRIEVPFKIIVGADKLVSLNKNYMINPNKVLAVDSTKINTTQKILGLVNVTEKECKFYYVDVNLFGAISSRFNELTNKTRQYLFDFYFENISLNDVLVKANAIIVDDENDCDINLSPEALEKDTIINLLIS